MIPFLKKYKFYLIAAAAIVAALVIAFISGGSISQVKEQIAATRDTPPATTITSTASEMTTIPSSAVSSAAAVTSAAPKTQSAENTYTTVSVMTETATEPVEKPTDKYKTEPVPTDKPKPVEPQEQTTQDNTLTCTFSISCATILDNMDSLDEELHELVPADGWLMKPEKVEFNEGESVYDVLLRVCTEKKIHLDQQFTPLYNTVYIKGIGNLYEFDCGENSGWQYCVNDWYPNYGCSRYVLKNHDTVAFNYTCNLGYDLGNIL